MFKSNRVEAGWVRSAALVLCLFSAAGFAGTLDPPGPPAPTMKTIDQAQPRIPVSTLPGSAQSLFVISAPGSYYLTGDITGVSGKNGIEIASNNVTLDLNGFNLLGVSGSLSGITTDLVSEVRDVIVKNGNVSAWGQDGIRLPAHSALISHVEARANGEKGISVWQGILEFCLSRNNPLEGLELVESGIVRNSTVIDNGTGIHATNGLIQGCVARGNGVGIDLSLEGQVIDCFVKNNSNGIRVYLNTLVSRCSVLENGYGVQVLSDGTRNRIEDNTFLSNDYGLVIDPPATRNVVLKNSFHRNATANYTIPPDNPYGPIIDARGLGDLSAVPGADHPWANFIF